jgi:copper homeostasis protein
MLAVVALIRPREGDFCYDEIEFQVCLKDIQHAKEAGCAGVAIGYLKAVYYPNACNDLQGWHH